MARTRRYQDHSARIPLSQLPAAALRAVLREGYSRQQLHSDVLAGVVVGIVALPLAMALAIAVGVAPQHGLYTAIVAGFLVALFGGSRSQVSGPTAAFIVVLAPIYAQFGLSGLLVAGLMSGFMLVALGLLRLGSLISYIPHPVTTGFTAGIATVIATLQLRDLFGLQVAGNPQHYTERVAAMFEARASASAAEFCIGAVTLLLLIAVPRVQRRIPAPIVVLPAVALAVYLLQGHWPGFHVATIATRFHSEVAGQVVAGIPRLPPLPLLPWQPGANAAQGVTFDMLRELLPSAFVVAMLGAIESLLSAVVADGMARTRHDPDSELLALGIGNIVAPFFGGIPATGAIARTATNIRSGARSPISAMTHAITVLLAVLLLAPTIGYLPMTSLAALLLIVAWNMSEVRHFVHTLKVAPKSDVTVLLTCYVLTVAMDMVIAVSVGIVLAALLFMRRMVEVTHVQLSEGEHAALPRALPPGVIVYDIAGPLFFGAAQKAMGALGAIADRAKVVILRLDQVPVLDATGLVALESAVSQLAAQRIQVVISGLQSQPASLLKKSGLDARSTGIAIRTDTAQALEAAEELLRQRIPTVPPLAPPA